MTVLIRILDESGHEVRRCDGRCHRAKPGGKSQCCCGGALRGVEREEMVIDPRFVDYVRRTVTLNPGEHVQLAIDV